MWVMCKVPTAQLSYAQITTPTLFPDMHTNAENAMTDWWTGKKRIEGSLKQGQSLYHRLEGSTELSLPAELQILPSLSSSFQTLRTHHAPNPTPILFIRLTRFPTVDPLHRHRRRR